MRRFIPPIPRLCSLAPSVTPPLYSTTVSQALRQTLRGKGPKEYPPVPANHEDMGDGTEDVEVQDISHLTRFSANSECSSNISSEATQRLSNGLRGDSNGIGGYSRNLRGLLAPCL
jgi:hypothetical protein